MRKIKQFVVILLFSVCSMLAQDVTGLAGWNIFLDPGHSKQENMGIYNYSEAHKNLRVALNLRELLLTKTDIDTVYISRTNDQQSVSLSQRTDHANRVGAAWYHSIHSDAGSPHRNSTLLLWGQYRNGQEKRPNGGKAMSDIMVDILTQGMRTNTSGSIGDCSFYGCSFSGPYLHVNRTTTMPSELSEAGFHTNPTQNQRNMNADWKRLEAWTFYWTFLKFHGIERPRVRILTGFIKDKETSGLINGATIQADSRLYTTDTYESLFHKYSTDAELLHNGFYYLEDISDSSANVVVEAPGYYNDTLDVEIEESFFTFLDVSLVSNVAPFIKMSTPAEADSAFPVWDDIVLAFSRPMNRDSVESAFSLEPAAAGEFFWYDNGKRLHFRADTLRFEAAYKLTLTSKAIDRYGHVLDGNGDGVPGDDFVIEFRTGKADMSPPQIISSYPQNNGKDISLSPIISFVYDENLDSTAFFNDLLIMEKYSNSQRVPGTWKYYYVRDHGILTIFPSEQLEPNNTYRVTVAAGISDVHGNKETVEKVLLFSTSDKYYYVTPIDNFDGGLSNWFVPQQSGSTTGIITDSTGVAENPDVVNLLSLSTRSMQMNYGWDKNAGSWLIREYLNRGPAKNVRFNKSYLLQVYVFGDGGGTQFRFCVDDRIPDYAAGNHEVSPWYTIDWYGWKLVSWDMTSDPVGAWLGDGKLDGTLGFDSIQLSYQPDTPTSGTIYFDDLRLAQYWTVHAGDGLPVAAPGKYALFQNYPNPFNPETTIRYDLRGGVQPVKLRIYNIMGELVRALVNETQTGGAYQIPWNGRDDRGRTVPSGVYVYRLDAGPFSETRRMLILK